MNVTSGTRSAVLALLLPCCFVFADGPTGLAAIKVPKGFSVEVAAGPELSSYPMFMTFDERGRMFIAESSGKDLSGKEMVAAPECVILRLEDENDDGVFDTRKVFADKLSLPMGVLWHQGSLFVASPPEFIRFDDQDGDGVAERRKVLLSGWNVFNTASLHGPFLGPDGWLYLTHGRHGYKITTKEGQTLEGTASRIWRCRTDGTGLERVTGGGFDNPVELAWSPGGDLFGTMTYFTDPKNGQRDALLHYVEGGVYPKFHESTAEFIRTGDLMPVMTRFARIAPSGLIQYQGEAFGAAYAGNLFSAQFNPHRVQRHVLKRDEGTYRTEDSDFMTSSDPDFHPTDVLEDADGSVLVSDTGAWYVDACPISRVAKPEIRGAIYRVWKDGAARPEDPWGTQAHLEDKSPADLAAALDDPRVKVRDRARELLVASGEQSVDALAEVLKSSSSERQRLGAVWALGRIDEEGARAAVAGALNDEAYTVRMAAAHAAAMTQNETAVPALTALLHDADPGVRRKAALALGRLGAKESAPALLAACAGAADRFEEHALIYATIQLNAQQPAAEALKSDAAPVRKAALIALDQMGSPLLTKDALPPFLGDENEEMRKTGLWVASRHADWSDVVLSFLASQLNSPDLDIQAAAPLRDTLLAYAGDAGVQTLIAEMAADASADPARRLFLMDVIDQSPLEELPESWVACLGKGLHDREEPIRWRAASLIRSRALTQFDADLRSVANDPAQTVSLRVNALGTLVTREPKLSEGELQFLLSALAADQEPAVRLAAGKVLAHAELPAETLRMLAADYLPKADALTFPALLDAFRQTGDESVGMALVKSLERAPINPNLIPGGLDGMLEKFPDSVREAAAPLRAQADAEAAARIKRLSTLEPLLGTGDVGRGRRIFFGDTVACSTCHAVGEEGGQLGPDLTTIGAIRSGHDLLEAVLFPSASFVPQYESYRIEMEFETLEGAVGRETPEAIYLRTAAKEELRIPRADILSMTPSPVSIMPEGLDVALSKQDLIDLVAFLQSLNNEVWLLPERRGDSEH
ncbi:MAG: HEAT repeat domain-containing protein [Candidatus Hydrogenedentes bacterium]|nr:HEAT repeat domain-containing protein [Candidatus Hydrogenedentota bacterium]